MLQDYLRKPVAFTLIIITCMIAGGIAAFKLPVKMYPDIIKPSLFTTYTDDDISLANDMYANHGVKLEPLIKKIDGIEKFSSVYTGTRARYNLEFEWGVDEEIAIQEISRFMDSEKGGNDRFNYMIRNFSNQTSGYLSVFFANPKKSREEMSQYIDDTLVPLLNNVKDVDTVFVGGLAEPRTMLIVDRKKMIQYKLTPDLLRQTISKMFTGIKVTELDVSGTMTPVVIPQKAVSVDDALKSVVTIDPVSGRKILLKDIATISDVFEKEDRISRLNGHDGSFIFINLKPESDVKRACNEIISVLEKYLAENPEVQHSVTVNPATFINKAIENLIWNALAGGLIAILVIFYYLRSFRNTIIIGISIPLSLITSFVLMSVYDTSINLISLGGLAIGVGMIVDASVVVLENIFRHLKELPNKANIEQKTKTIIKATKEVWIPVVVTTITSIITFVPILYTASYAKAILGDLVKTIIFIQIISMFIAIFVVPGASQWLLTLKERKSSKRTIEEYCRDYYVKILRKLLYKRRYSVLLSVVMVAIGTSSLFMVPMIKKEIIARPNSDLVQFNMDIPNNDNIEKAKNYVKQVEEWLSTRPEVINHFARAWNPSNVSVSARIKSSDQFQNLSKDFSQKFVSNPDIEYKTDFFDPGAMPIPEMNDMLIEITGESTENIHRYSDMVAGAINRSGAFARKSPRFTPESTIELKFKDYINPSAYPTNYVQASSETGMRLGSFIDQGKKKFLYMTVTPEERFQSFEQIAQVPVVMNDNIIPLKAISDIKYTQSTSLPIQYINDVQAHEIVVTFKPGSDKESLEKEIKSMIAKIPAPDGTSLIYKQANVEISKSIESFSYSLIASIGFIFIVIAITFNSIRYPIIIILTVPLAIIGVIIGLFIAKSTISLNSMLGIILLAGLVVNNAILLFDFYVSRISPKDFHTANGIDAIVEAASLRFRPILMTTLASLFGVLPLAFGMGDGADVLQPLGVATFSGLLVSTALTLFVIPCAIRLWDHGKFKM